MIFASNVFLFLYLPIFFLIYFLAKPIWRSSVIVLASYIFYAWWRPDFLILFAGITFWNFWLGLKIKEKLDADNKSGAKKLLLIGVIGNLSTLAYFKYANFGVDVIAALLEPLGVNTFTLEKVILPLGISFYIFHALSYIVDIYRKEAVPTKSLVDFAAFVALFPHLVAGPILRYSDLAPQLKNRTHSLELFSIGVGRFMIGFIMKVLIADNLAPISGLFIAQNELGIFESWFGLLAASLQLYFDFAGYSNMAIGLALMMGFRFPENFNQPFIAQSITEFWHRWHMTLAHYLRDYVFTPLVRQRVTGPMLAIIITMLLSGFWHGASFAFIFWGLFFGIAMVVERKFKLATKVNSPYKIHRHAICMLVLFFSMPLFFTNDLAHSLDIYEGLLGFNSIGGLELYSLGTSNMTMFFVIVALAWLFFAGRNNIRFYAGKKEDYFMSTFSGVQAVALWLGFILALTSLAANSFSPFLYFQF